MNQPTTTALYTLSLHDALPISPDRRAAAELPFLFRRRAGGPHPARRQRARPRSARHGASDGADRSEEHTSELQSRQYLVCRLLLEKKKDLGLVLRRLETSRTIK